MKYFLFLLLTLPFVAFAGEDPTEKKWPDQIRGGLFIAKQYCETKAESLSEIVVFEFIDDNNETQFYMPSCREVLWIASQEEGIET